MSYTQLHDALTWAADYQADLVRQYRDLASKTPSQRMQLLLEYLANHSEEAELGLRRHLESASPAQLATWSRSPPHVPQPTLLDELKRCLCCSSVEELTDVALRIHRTLEDFYDVLGQAADLDEQRQLMIALRDAEQSETRRMVRDIARFETC